MVLFVFEYCWNNCLHNIGRGFKKEQIGRRFFFKPPDIGIPTLLVTQYLNGVCVHSTTGRIVPWKGRAVVLTLWALLYLFAPLLVRRQWTRKSLWKTSSALNTWLSTKPLMESRFKSAFCVTIPWKNNTRFECTHAMLIFCYTLRRAGGTFFALNSTANRVIAQMWSKTAIHSRTP